MPDISPIHAHTILQTKDATEQGRFYHSSYEIENFIQSYDDTGGDPFKVLSDPTYSGFKLFFHFDATSGLLADETYTNSALAYLKRIGQTKRYELLKRFINTLSRVNSITPWIFQEITGLREIYEQPWTDVFYTVNVEIQTLETIDCKIQSLVEMYRNIVFDFNRHVYVVPENLRDFSMSIFIYDYRIFASTSKTALDFLQTIENTDVKQLNHVMFDLGECSFNITSGGSFFDSVTNNRAEANTNNLSISSQRVSISSLFKSITGNQKLRSAELDVAGTIVSNGLNFRSGGTINGSIPATNGIGQTVTQDGLTNPNTENKFVARLTQSGLYKTLAQRAEEYTDLIENEGWKRNLKILGEQTENRILQAAEAELTRLYFGNIHGFSFGDILRLNQDNDYRAAFNQLYSTINGNQSLNLDPGPASNLGNVNTQ